MKLWLDQMLPRRLCRPIQDLTGCETSHVGTEYPEDPDIFEAARRASATILTKDRDFVALVERHGPPPQVIWLTCGNCSNRGLERILRATLLDVLTMLRDGEPIVEITGAEPPA